MVKRNSGVSLTISTTGSRIPGPGYLGYGVTCGAVEAFTRILAGELGPSGIRTVCIRPDAIPEALTKSHSSEVFEGLAERADTIEVAFTNRAGVHWIRRGSGSLVQIEQPAAEHYGIPEPVGWTLP
jgi:NAD(P)-dependent dehydrogenase (short-subunit alcohol dehydrogenase family)